MLPKPWEVTREKFLGQLEMHEGCSKVPLSSSRDGFPCGCQSLLSNFKLNPRFGWEKVWAGKSGFSQGWDWKGPFFGNLLN